MLNIIERVKAALVKSWQTDNIAFIAELIGTLFTVIASLTLATHAKDPNMVAIFPLYQVGSIALIIAYYRREMVWSIALAGYFIVINTVGFFIALG